MAIGSYGCGFGQLGVGKALARLGVIVVGVSEVHAPLDFRGRQNELLLRAALPHADQRLVHFGQRASLSNRTIVERSLCGHFVTSEARFQRDAVS